MSNRPRLQLRKETLRELQTTDLKAVEGAGTTLSGACISRQGGDCTTWGCSECGACCTYWCGDTDSEAAFCNSDEQNCQTDSACTNVTEAT